MFNELFRGPAGDRTRHDSTSCLIDAGPIDGRPDNSAGPEKTIGP